MGIVTAHSLAGETQPKDLDEIMRPDFPRCDPNALLSEVYKECSTGLPLAVVDAAGHLIGVVDPLEVFSQLIQGDGSDGHANGDSPNDWPASQNLAVKQDAEA